MTKPYLKLTDTGNREGQGLRILALDLYVSGRIHQTWYVNSGQPDHQDLFAYNDPESYSGDKRPIPEGIYDIGQLEFAGGRFDWKDSWGPGLGDFWAAIRPLGGETKRKAFGFHWDENRGQSPGSLGCVVFATKADVESFVAAMRKFDPGQMFVDWGLGKVVSPKTAQPTAAAGKKPSSPDTATVTLDGQDLGQVPLVDGRAVATVPLVAALFGYTAAWDAKNKTVALSRQPK